MYNCLAYGQPVELNYLYTGRVSQPVELVNTWMSYMTHKKLTTQQQAVVFAAYFSFSANTFIRGKMAVSYGDFFGKK